MFLTVIFLFWPIARSGAEQRQPIMMEAEMILAIEDRLPGADFVQENLIDVVSEKGIVTLLGEVDNILAKERAARVKEVFLHDPLLDHKTIMVSASNQAISLRGTVKSGSQKSRAELLAARVKGATTVDNRLKYAVEWQDKSDPKLRQDIKDQLW